jgi:NAD(P)-dependent dehydrogenase (short-subunit alcohol dehydrogenase family)
MFELAGKVAAITGAGSGIGAALTRECSRRGMRVVAADINRERVEAVVASLPDPAATRAVTVDVSDAAEVDRMADVAYGTFGATHLLCNVAGHQSAWLGLGVHRRGLEPARGRQPHLDRQCHPQLCPTDDRGWRTGPCHEHWLSASFQGQSILGPYVATKHAILGHTDSLRQDLASHDIGVSLLCPGGVNTNIVDSMARPSSTGDESVIWAYIDRMMADNDEATNTMIEPEVVAEHALWGIREGLPYIICAPGQKARVEKRFRTILDAHDQAAVHDQRLP